MELKVCELCGRSDEHLTDAVIEGAMLSICRRCVKFGHVLPIQKPNILLVQRKETQLEKEPDEIELLMPDYAEKIQHARESLNLTQEELALKLAERVSLIQRIESGKLKPTMNLARKLETFFKIKLIEKYKEDNTKKVNFLDSALTIGDILKLKKK